MWVESAMKTDVGRKRTNNEDALGVFRNARITVLAVADGMGGHQAGEVASGMAIEGMKELPDRIGVDDPDQEVLFALEVFFQELNGRIYEASSESDSHKRMGTTLTAAVFRDNKLFVGHIGDSRLYRMRNGHIELMTNDHSFVGEQVRLGVLTEEEAENHPNKNIITRAMGIRPEIKPDTLSVPVEEGDIYLACSDGLTGHVNKDELCQISTGNTDLGGAIDNMVQMALDRGGLDNISVVMGRARAGEVPAHILESAHDNKCAPCAIVSFIKRIIGKKD